MNLLSKVTITNKIEIAKKVLLIEFKREFDFIPGQIIGITNKPDLPPRLYSICSSPTNQTISILFNVKTEGELTPPLAQMSKGDNIWITNPQGKFTFNNEPAWWIATGTGVAPFFSMFTNGKNL
ncbi:MAG: hypothetical protein DRJ10_12215 [Bacteroidetes bacterium]|nr:MAG: hypothetical protein DRJ10_12215 [Bacteroidota bacterium]